MARIKTTPAVQWTVTQEKCRPTLGRKAEKSRVSMAAAITQWNILADIECRGTFSGMQDVICRGTESGSLLDFELK